VDARVRRSEFNVTGGAAPAGTSGRVRLDKWLWAARFYRTRTLSAQAIDAGHVRVDGERVKAAHPIRAGMRVSVRKQALTWSVDVLNVAERRGSATDAAALYVETADSAALRDKAIAEQKAARAQAQGMPVGRPTKRDRRRLEDFLNEP
jgi:ribosome-associated heat shock protein Hsp15